MQNSELRLCLNIAFDSLVVYTCITKYMFFVQVYIHIYVSTYKRIYLSLSVFFLFNTLSQSLDRLLSRYDSFELFDDSLSAIASVRKEELRVAGKLRALQQGMSASRYTVHENRGPFRTKNPPYENPPTLSACRSLVFRSTIVL